MKFFRGHRVPARCGSQLDPGSVSMDCGPQDLILGLEVLPTEENEIRPRPHFLFISGRNIVVILLCILPKRKERTKIKEIKRHAKAKI